jgi:3-hydroxyacyl-[acyl-carrier-protein] dehydratase
MLLLYSVSASTTGEVVAHKAVTAGECEFADGDMRIYPPMLVLESWCQTAAFLMVQHDGSRSPGAPVFLASLSQVTLRGDAHPGQVIDHHAGWVENVGGTPLICGWSAIGEQRILEVGRALLVVGSSTP